MSELANPAAGKRRLPEVLHAEQLAEAFDTSVSQARQDLAADVYGPRFEVGKRTVPAIEVLWTEDIASILNRSTAAVTELFRLGKLPGRKVGRRWCCPRLTFERWLAGEDVER